MSSVPVSPAERMLLAGKHLFATQGFENTTTAAIAREAGTSESQLVKYFGNKEGLLTRIFEAGWERVSFVYTAAAVSQSPLDSLRVIFELLTKLLTEDREFRDLMMFEGRRIRGKDSQILLSSGYPRLQQEVTTVLERLLAGSALAQKIRPHVIAVAFVGMLESLVRDQAISERKTGTPDPTSAEIRAMFHLFASCLASEGSSSKE